MTDAQMHKLIASAARRLAHRRAVERGDPMALKLEKNRDRERRRRARRAAKDALIAS